MSTEENQTNGGHHIQMLPVMRNFVHRVAVDVTSILVLLIPILCFYLWGKPYHRGFNCDDDTIRYPYQENTISSTALYFYSTAIPLVVIVVNEWLLKRCQLATSQSRSVWEAKHFWKCFFWQVYLQLIPFAFVAAASQLVTDIAKYSIGRLRPHFIDLCQPQLATGRILNRYSNCDEPHTYVTEYRCTNNLTSSKSLRDSRLSFMSGHSSFAAVCLAYLVIYMQVRVKWSQLGLLKPLAQCLLLSLALYIGLSRISDYKHHWSDVLAGLVQGTLVAVLGACFVSDLFKPYSQFGTLKRPCSATSNNQPIDPESGV